jgi:phospholipase D1/2
MDFINVQTPDICNIDRDSAHRMPWHDIHMMIVGDPVLDLVRHFIQYWNFA